jgi:TatD DNase family protein
VSACGSASPAPCFASRLVATAGIHPHNAATWNAAAAAELRALCARGAVAVGEVGLDFHYDFSPRPAQVRAFAEQGALALELGLPLVMHCREAWPEFLAVVRELGLGRATGVGGRSASVPARIECPGPATGVGGRSASVPARIAGLAPAWGVVHCFSGTPDQALELVAMGLLIGIGGTVTFKRNNEGREVARAVPLEALLLETDAPYLAPVPLRGRRNEPAMMVHSARCVAEVRGMAPEDLACATRANALRLFPALAKG